MSDEELLECTLTEGRRKARDEWTRKYLVALLKKTGGNISHAAKIAGVDRCNLRRVMHQLAIDFVG